MRCIEVEEPPLFVHLNSKNVERAGNSTQRLSSLVPYSAEPHNVQVNRVKHWWRDVKTFFLPKFLCWYIRLLLSGTVGLEKGIADTVVVDLIPALNSYFTSSCLIFERYFRVIPGSPIMSKHPRF